MPEYPLKQMKSGPGCHLNTVGAEKEGVTQDSNWESRFHPRPLSRRAAVMTLSTLTLGDVSSSHYLPLANYPSMLRQIRVALSKSLTANYRIVGQSLLHHCQRLIHVLRLTMPTPKLRMSSFTDKSRSWWPASQFQDIGQLEEVSVLQSATTKQTIQKAL